MIIYFFVGAAFGLSFLSFVLSISAFSQMERHKKDDH